ncbi:MAG: hypothetical protein M5U28_39840 [Sandaracinaceae bacterium]|nr:hypothetical protein [Sandaracinaceae bacterium]
MALVATLLGLAGTAQAQCDWTDGMDSRAPRNDPGRGISDWTQHQAYASSNERSAATVPDLIAARFDALRACSSAQVYAQLYADASVLIAHYGRAHAAWVDAMDARAPSDDPGRGVAAHGAHREYASGAAAANVSRLVRRRLSDLRAALPPAMFARLYADVSILLANYARMR